MRALSTLSVAASAAAVACRGSAPADVRDSAEVPSMAVGPPAQIADGAHAAVVIRDGDAYSFRIPSSARACIVFPGDLFDPSACPPQAKPVTGSPAVPDNVRLVAIGLVQIVDDRGVHRQAQLTASLDKLPHSHQPSQQIAEAFAAGLIARAPTLAHGATVREASQSVRLVPMGSLTGARVSFDMDGAVAEYARFQHTVAEAVWAPEGTYVLAINSASADAAAFDALADEVAASVHLARPAPPLPEAEPGSQ